MTILFALTQFFFAHLLPIVLGGGRHPLNLGRHFGRQFSVLSPKKKQKVTQKNGDNL